MQRFFIIVIHIVGLVFISIFELNAQNLDSIWSKVLSSTSNNEKIDLIDTVSSIVHRLDKEQLSEKGFLYGVRISDQINTFQGYRNKIRCMSNSVELLTLVDTLPHMRYHLIKEAIQIARANDDMIWELVFLEKELDHYMRLSLFEEASEASVKIMDLALLLDSVIVGKSNIVKLVAEFNYKTLKYDKAADAILIAESLNDFGDESIEINKMLFYNTKGLVYRQVNQLDEAISAFEDALDIATEDNDIFWQGLLMSNLADALRRKGEKLKAINIARQSLSLLEEVENYGVHKVDVLISLGLLYRETGQLQRAVSVYNIADSLLHSSVESAVSLTNLRLGQYRLYKELKQFDVALEYSEAYHELKDSFKVISQNNKIDIVNARNEYLLESQKLKTEEAELQLNRLRWNQTIIIYAILSLLGFGLLAFEVVRQKRKREKEKARLSEKLTQANNTLNDLVKKLRSKTQMYEELKGQIETNEISSDTDKDSYLTSLNKIQILTEEDWQIFREAFGQIHGDFLAEAENSKIPFSQGDLRLMALLRLGLDTKEIGMALGISPGSVRKNKYRLRKKLREFGHDNIKSMLLADFTDD